MKKTILSFLIFSSIILNVSAGYLGLVLDNIYKKKSELIKILINNLRK